MCDPLLNIKITWLVLVRYCWHKHSGQMDGHSGVKLKGWMSRAQKKGREQQKQKGLQSQECGIGRGGDQPASSER